MSFYYREIKKEDYTAIKNIINESFGLYRYVNDKRVLGSFLNSYLYSCLSEATFTCAAVRDERVVGVIMGNAKRDYRSGSHLKYTLAAGYYSAAMTVKSAIYSTPVSDYRRMHRIYHELRSDCGREFDGVLTLFAITEDCRGLGAGKELLNRLLEYLKKQQVKSIYLYTDSACNVGFYEHEGFERLCEQSACMTRDSEAFKMNIYLYGLKI